METHDILHVCIDVRLLWKDQDFGQYWIHKKFLLPPFEESHALQVHYCAPSTHTQTTHICVLTHHTLIMCTGRHFPLVHFVHTSHWNGTCCHLSVSHALYPYLHILQCPVSYASLVLTAMPEIIFFLVYSIANYLSFFFN